MSKSAACREAGARCAGFAGWCGRASDDVADGDGYRLNGWNTVGQTVIYVNALPGWGGWRRPSGCGTMGRCRDGGRWTRRC